MKITAALRKQVITEHYARIGALGGAAGRGTPQRKRIARAAALARWSKIKAVNKSVNNTPKKATGKVAGKVNRGTIHKHVSPL